MPDASRPVVIVVESGAVEMFKIYNIDYAWTKRAAVISGFTGERSNPQFLFHHSDNLLLRGESTVQWKEEMVLYLRLNLPSQYSTIIGVPR